MVEKIFDIILGWITFGLSQKRKKDRNLFEELMITLPSDSSSIVFLEEHDMGNAFEFDLMSPLNRVVKDWLRPDNKFQSKKIEKKKCEFVAVLKEFLDLFGTRSGGVGRGFISIGMRDDEDREGIWQLRNDLNKLGTQAHEKYFEFVIYAHRNLPV